MAVAEKTKRIIWHQAGGRCSICRMELLISSSDPITQSFIGDIAHIVAQQPNGPRGKSELTSADRDDAENLMLLCATHHRIIDDQEKAYPVEKLLSLKAAHEAWVISALTPPRKIDLKLANFSYINVPRLAMMAALQGLSIDTTEIVRVGNFKDMGLLLPTLLAFEQLFGSMRLAAAEFQQLNKVGDHLIGVTFEFSCRFRTKNIGAIAHGASAQFSGNLNKDPHIYTKKNGFKLVLRIDPRWITTNSAYVEFNSGQVLFAGFFLVTNIDVKNKLIYGTPLLIGTPRSTFMDAIDAVRNA